MNLVWDTGLWMNKKQAAVGSLFFVLTKTSEEISQGLDNGREVCDGLVQRCDVQFVDLVGHLGHQLQHFQQQLDHLNKYLLHHHFL